MADKYLQRSDGVFVQRGDGSFLMGETDDGCCCYFCVYVFKAAPGCGGATCEWDVSLYSADCLDYAPAAADRDRWIGDAHGATYTTVGDACEVDGDCAWVGDYPDPPGWACECGNCLYEWGATCADGVWSWDNGGVATKTCTTDLPAVGNRDRWLRSGDHATYYHVGDLCVAVGDCGAGTAPSLPTYPCDYPACTYHLHAECNASTDHRWKVVSVTKSCEEAPPGEAIGEWIRDDPTHRHKWIVTDICDDVGDCPDLTGDGEKVGDDLGEGCDLCTDCNWFRPGDAGPPDGWARWRLHYTLDICDPEQEAVDIWLYSEHYPDYDPMAACQGVAEYFYLFGQLNATVIYRDGGHWQLNFGNYSLTFDSADCTGWTISRPLWSERYECWRTETWTFEIELMP